MLRLSRFVASTVSSKGLARASKQTEKRDLHPVAAKKPSAATAAAVVTPSAAWQASPSMSPAARDHYSNSHAADFEADSAALEAHAHAAPQDSHNLQTHAGMNGAQHQDHRSAGKLNFDASKAGLQQVNKDYVEHVIEEASKGSAFYQKEQRLEETRRRKAEELQEKAKSFDSISTAEKQKIKAMVDTMVDELEATRDLRRRYIHIDMDMFYAAVEEKKTPSLREKPFGVGSQQMLSTTNYIARQYGVRSGMPGFIGKKLCPELIIVPNDFPAYQREAARVHSIASRYDAQFVSVGLDELTMDVTKYLQEFPAVSASDIAHDFRDEVFLKTQLTSSGGIGPTSILAKIASNVNKPNGQHEITLLTREEVIDYVRDIPLRKIPGIGYAQEMTLGALHIHTCGGLLQHKYLLAYLFREKTLAHYLSVGLGLAETFSQRRHQARQSVGKETSFSEPLPSPEAFTRIFRKLLEQCHVRCVRDHLQPRKMTLVLKYRTFDTEQFSVALPSHTNDLKVWLEASQKLLEPHLLHYAELRLIGVRLLRFTDADDDHIDINSRSRDALTGALTGVHEVNEDFDMDADDASRDAEKAALAAEQTGAYEGQPAQPPAMPKRKIPVSKFLTDPNIPKPRLAEPAVAAAKVIKPARKRAKASKHKLHKKK
ncbi:putative impB/mucB/samB family/impB/mucB/samB family C-terminal domain containing protein [Leishmania utingensis]|uniref:DNA polymerase kappa n=1 Tax=Leishmania utingensis TaxID=653362 RepID=A0AAW3A8E7_9TRYP